MSEAMVKIGGELLTQAPVLFVCLLAGFAQFSWYKHTINVIKEISEKSSEQVKKTYEDACKLILESHNMVHK